MKLLGIDLETGGSFDGDIIKDNFITEIGAVLWDTEHNTPVKMINELVNYDKEISEDATVYTGITNSMVKEYGSPLQDVMSKLLPMWEECDYIVAQNGLEFDKPIIFQEAEKIGISLQERTWVDLKIDVDFPKNCMSKSLIYLNGFHGFCNPFPHRAITDVLSMFLVMKNYDIDRIVESAKSPIVEVVWKSAYPQMFRYKNNKAEYAKAMKEFNETKEKVRKHGFRWMPEEKEWVLKTREALIPEMDFNYTKRSI